MFILATLFAALSFAASTFLAPHLPTAAKLAPYESGIVPEYEPAQRFPVRFYLVAMIFIVFDIEIVFLYPWAVVFRQLAVFGLVEMGIFLVAVLVAYAYLLSSGALDWGPPRWLGESAMAPVLRIGNRDDEPGESMTAERMTAESMTAETSTVGSAH
jgi:NADH-quinone oxidoreductase subunit A